MTKKEFVKRFDLIKTKTKCIFYDGLAQKERTLYKNNYNMFVFYNNDLSIVKPYETYTEGMEEIECRLEAAYSWYH